MSASAEFIIHVHELLSSLGQLSQGRFFGGHAIKHDGKQFAMIMGNTLYFRVDDQTRPEYITNGAKPFSYLTKLRAVQVKTYYSVPAELLESRSDILPWARKAIHAASGA